MPDAILFPPTPEDEEEPRLPRRPGLATPGVVRHQKLRRTFRLAWDPPIPELQRVQAFAVTIPPTVGRSKDIGQLYRYSLIEQIYSVIEYFSYAALSVIGIRTPASRAHHKGQLVAKQ